jgi:hypothetical protein
VMRQIAEEMKRRAGGGLLAPKLRKEARALRDWAEVNIEIKAQIPQVRGIENALRKPYYQLRSLHWPAHKT